MTELFLYNRDNGIFKQILRESKEIEGRYHVSPNYGHDLNTNNLDTFFKDTAYGMMDVEQKYPLCVCMTPVSRFTKINGQKWEVFFFHLFFLTRAFHDGANNIKKIDRDTNTSRQNTYDDWSEMKQCCSDFLEMLDKVIRKKGGDIPLRAYLNLDYERAQITRLTKFNNDKLNGASLTFMLSMITDSCTLSDYANNALGRITIPNFIYGSGGNGNDNIVNFNGFSFNDITGVFTFDLPSGVEQNTLDGRLLEVGFFNPENPNLNYINSEGTAYSTSPSTSNIINNQYLTPGTVLVKWRIISAVPDYEPITEYTSVELVVDRISNRYFKLCVKDSLVGVQEGQFPITPLNVNGDELAEVSDIDEYITVMNADTANQGAFTVNSYRKFPANGPAEYYELLLEPTAPYQAWQFNRKLEAII